MSKFHYKRSPSATERWINCPGSVRLSEGIPRKESEYAKEGTAAHDLAEQCLKTGNKACMVSEDEETVDAIQVYLDDIQRARESYVVIAEHTERTIKSQDIDNFGGTQDHLMIYLDDGKLICHVWDYKHGVGVVVDAEDNLQALSYFAIIQSNYVEIFDEFRITIIQPRSFSEEKIKYWVCSHERVQAHIAAIRKAEQEDHLHAGDWCRWCPALGLCPEVRNHTLRIAQMEFEDVRDNVDILFELQRVEPAVRKLLDQVPSALLEAYRRSPIPGYKVIENLSNRAWSNPKAVAEEFSKAGVPNEILYEIKQPEFRSAPQIEKLLAKTEFSYLVKAKKGEVSRLNQLTYRVPTSRKVVPDSHKGIAVDLKDVSEFEDMSE